METSYSVRFIGHFPLTFPSSRGKILSKSVMPLWPAVSCHGVRGFAFCRPFPDSPRALSSASVRGLFLYLPGSKGSALRLPGSPLLYRYTQKIAGLSGGVVNSQKRPPPPYFFGG